MYLVCVQLHKRINPKSVWMWMKNAAVSAEGQNKSKRRTSTTVTSPSNSVYSHRAWMCERAYACVSMGTMCRKSAYCPVAVQMLLVGSAAAEPQRGGWSRCHIPLQSCTMLPISRWISLQYNCSLLLSTLKSISSTCARSPQANEENNNTVDPRRLFNWRLSSGTEQVFAVTVPMFKRRARTWTRTPKCVLL